MNHRFLPEYRGDIKKFLESPGGRYVLQTLVAKETELLALAAKAETADKKAECVDRWQGVYFVRDLLARWSQVGKASLKGQETHSPDPTGVDSI